MGLYVSTMKELPTGDRTLYVYLLDYGWPDGEYERLFHENFGHLSQRASETGAVVVMSNRGVHFANEVLNWHKICGHEASDILPAILMTHTHPRYFADQENDGNLGDIALLPLGQFCTTPQDFLRTMASIFDDLDKGLTLRNFRAEQFDVLRQHPRELPRWEGGSVGAAVILQPNFAGIGIDLKKLFSRKADRKTAKGT